MLRGKEVSSEEREDKNSFNAELDRETSQNMVPKQTSKAQARNSPKHA
jgi:hypothetical protein